MMVGGAAHARSNQEILCKPKTERWLLGWYAPNLLLGGLWCRAIGSLNDLSIE